MKRFVVFALIILLLASGTFLLSLDKDMRRLLMNIPTNFEILFWSVPQRDAAFRVLDRLPVLAKTRIIHAGAKDHTLPLGDPLDIGVDINAYMTDQRTAALLIIQDGKIRLEKYGLEFDQGGRWASFSVAKSITSTLVGAAIKDGFITSVDDKISDYIPDLRGSVYDDVTIRQVLTMTSGVAWNEDYGDPNSDVALFNAHKAAPGVDVTVSYMRTLEREDPPGTKWVYKTGETNLIGVLVSSATKMNISDYLSEKIWRPFGMQQDASWILGSTGHEMCGCCIQASARDFARFGLFMLGGGIADGKSVLPEDWISEATKRHADTNYADYGYGYQWWTLNDDAYSARGIFGQGIFIDPKRNLVIASNSNWPQASDYLGGDQNKKRLAFYRKVQLAIDKERNQ